MRPSGDPGVARRARRPPGPRRRTGGRPGPRRMARELVAEQGLTNVEVIQADARRTGLPPALFDVAHARTVLVNVPDPGAVLAEMTRLSTGRLVASLSRTWPSTCITQPTPPGADCMRSPSPPSRPMVRTHSSAAVYRSCFARLGSATSACERTPSFTRPATPFALSESLVRSMRPKIVALGIASEQELDDLDCAAREHLDDPHTLVLPHCSSWPGPQTLNRLGFDAGVMVAASPAGTPGRGSWSRSRRAGVPIHMPTMITPTRPVSAATRALQASPKRVPEANLKEPRRRSQTDRIG